MKKLRSIFGLLATLGPLAVLVLANVVVALTPTSAEAGSFNGDLFSNGNGHFVCICGGTNCEPCGTVT